MPKEKSPTWVRSALTFPVGAAGLAGTGAITLLDTLVLGYHFVIESIRWITHETLVGAGGTQGIEVRAGGATGTLLATVQPTVASQAAVGSTLSSPVSDAAAEIASDSGGFSLVRKSGGTAFTAGGGSVVVNIKQHPQG